MLRVLLQQVARSSCRGIKDFGVNGIASKSLRHVCCLSRSGDNEHIFVAINVDLMWSCHDRHVLTYSRHCSTRMLIQKSLLFSTQSSDNGQKENSDFSDKNFASNKSKVLSDSESVTEKVLETQRTNESEQTEAPIDVDAELLRYDYEELELTDDTNVEPSVKQKPKKILPFPQKRGQYGVFDLDEMCALLRIENARDICVIRVPPELKYVDFLILATGRSPRHLRALAEYIQWAYKQKRSKSDPQFVKLEGELTNDWFALDLGNIAVHLMSNNTREVYDLEQLWAVGPEFDEQTQARSLSDVNAAASLEEFSFDAELEKFRQLRLEEAKEKSSKTEPKRKQSKKTVPSQMMDSLTGWHSAN